VTLLLPPRPLAPLQSSRPGPEPEVTEAGTGEDDGDPKRCGRGLSDRDADAAAADPAQ